MVISLSSVLAKNKEITGDMLNKAHPTPMGSVLTQLVVEIFLYLFQEVLK